MAQITHWHILGAGNMGCLWAHYLHAAGHSVTLLAKNSAQQQQLLQQKHLRVQYQQQTFTTALSAELQVGHIHICTPEQLNIGSIHHLLICLKAHQTPQAIALIKPYISTESTVVLLQNGMGNQQLLHSALPHASLYAAITTEAACKIDTLHIEHTGIGLTHIGLLNNKPDTTLLDKLDSTLNITLNDDIEKVLWQKLVVNCCINSLSAIYECKNGELAHNPQAQVQIKAIIEECRTIAQLMGQSTALMDIEQTVADVIHTTAKNTSSMRQDILQQRTTEIDYINGFIVKQAIQHQVAAPINAQLVKTIQQLSPTT
jgi:2-dehydropantoate 2-reductase